MLSASSARKNPITTKQRF